MMSDFFKCFSKKSIGTVSQHDCPSCKKNSYWELCTLTIWFSLFGLPLIPYKKSFGFVCDKCDNLVELSEEEFISIKTQLSQTTHRDEPEKIKYLNKNSLQINYLKTLESYK